MFCPLLCSLLFNVCTFIYTVRKISNNKAHINSTLHLRKRKGEGYIYMRLFSVMAIPWLFGFLANFHYLKYFFSFFNVIINPLEGVFIFVSFCFSKRVRKLWKERNQSQSTTSTSNTHNKHVEENTKI